LSACASQVKKIGPYEIEELFSGGKADCGKIGIARGLGDGSKKLLVGQIQKRSRLLAVLEEKVWAERTELDKLVSFCDY
jgi:hypothetical protein